MPDQAREESHDLRAKVARHLGMRLTLAWDGTAPPTDPFSQSESSTRQPSDAPASLPLNAWNLSKVWGRKPGNRVIDDLELTLEPGRLRWIGGSNGVGKTTLDTQTSVGCFDQSKIGSHPRR